MTRTTSKHATAKSTTKAIAQQFIGSVWLYPALLFGVLLILTAFKISGTSVGIYHPIFNGGTVNPHLIANHPQSIRSDEWLVNTQLTIAQDAAGYPRFNQNFDSGRDMSVGGDVPYKDWSAVFKPQNFAFFALPFEHAFAFKWWLILFLTIVSLYFVVLRFFPGKRLLAALLSTAFACSPFFFWWYLTGTFASVFYCLFIILICLRMLGNEPVPFLRKRSSAYSQAVYVAVLSYLLACFALLLYPPFQIPVAIVTAFFLAGAFLQKYGSRQLLFSRDSLVKLGLVALSCIIAVSAIFTFLYTRRDAISALTNTVYPGKRIVEGGNASIHPLVSSYLQFQLQRPERVAHYYNTDQSHTNQSEESNFLLLLPFLLIPGFVLAYLEYRRFKTVNWPLLTVQACAILFLMHLFVPGLQPLYQLFLLDKVPHARLLIGIGFLGILQLLLITQSIQKLKLAGRGIALIVLGYTVLCLGVLIWEGLYIRSLYPAFLRSIPLIILASAGFAAVIYSFLSRRFLLGAALLFILSIGSVYRIHPIYQGLSPLYPNRLLSEMRAMSQPDDTWVSMDGIHYENFGLMSGRDSLSGVRPYPDIRFWRGVEGPAKDNIYNRYAHILFTSDPSVTTNIQLIQSDVFRVRFACTPFIKKHVEFAVTPHKLNAPCLGPPREVRYPTAVFYLYPVH